MSDEDRIAQAAQAFSSRVQATLTAELEAFVAELSRTVAEERAEAQATTAERVAGELSAAKADAERRLQEETARLRAETERAAQEAASRAAADVAAVRADAERRVLDEIARIREDGQRAVQESARAARVEAEASFEIERARVAAEWDQAAKFQVTAALATERQLQMQAVERIAEAIRRFDHAQSLTQVLTALVEGAAAEAPRVAMLTLQGRRIRSWRLAGFGPDVPSVDLAVEESGVVARALEQQDIAFAEPAAPDHPIPPGPGFTAIPADRSGIAVPLLVGGAPVAVLYADDVSDTEQAKPAAWPEAVEIMARHAAVRLENLTVVRTAQVPSASGAGGDGRPGRAGEARPARLEDNEAGEARRYARLLLSEIKLYNESAVRVGCERGDLLLRLRNDLDRARKLYDERIPAAVGSKWLLFDDELVQTLADGDPSRLGPRTDALA